MKAPFFNLCKEPISFYIKGLDFISLDDAKKFLEINKNFSIADLEILIYTIGRPNYINIEASIKEETVVFYDDKEIQWKCEEDCDNCVANPFN